MWQTKSNKKARNEMEMEMNKNMSQINQTKMVMMAQFNFKKVCVKMLVLNWKSYTALVVR